VPDEALEHCRRAVPRGEEMVAHWERRLAGYEKDYPDEARELKRRLAGELPKGWESALKTYQPGEELASRQASQAALNALAGQLPELFGGAADLSESNLTMIKDAGDFGPETAGRNLWFGVREHAMGGAANGIAYRWVRLEIERDRRFATLTVSAPDGDQPATPSAFLAAGSSAWAIAAWRELDDALLHLRFNEPEVGVVLLRTAGLMTSHVGRVRECRRLDAEGVPPAAAAERLKRNRYYVQKLYEQAGNFSEDELDDAVVRLARLDHALKGGSKLPGELEFTRALIDVSRGTAAT